MRGPDRAVLAVFLLVVLIGGTNFVGVRFSNRELPPFWGAGIRFVLAGLLLIVYARLARIPLPAGRPLQAALAYGVVNFGLSYALAYWALLEAPAALAATIVALTPLLTLLLAVALAMERFRWSGIVGGLVAVAGVGVVFLDQLRASVPLASIVAVLAMAVVISASIIFLKRLPKAHPIGTNAVAMLPGAALLLLLSAIAGETWSLPTRTDVWLALLYLATVGAIGLFVGATYVVIRWTASAASYATVLFPIVTVAVGTVLAGEIVTWQFIVGTGLVMLGTYVGAIAQPATAAAAPQALPGSSASRP